MKFQLNDIVKYNCQDSDHFRVIGILKRENSYVLINEAKRRARQVHVFHRTDLIDSIFIDMDTEDLFIRYDDYFHIYSVFSKYPVCTVIEKHLIPVSTSASFMRKL